MKIEYLKAKTATDAEILSFLRKHMNTRLIDASPTEIEYWTLVRKEAQKRKIGPSAINVAERSLW